MTEIYINHSKSIEGQLCISDPSIHHRRARAFKLVIESDYGVFQHTLALQRLEGASLRPSELGDQIPVTRIIAFPGQTMRGGVLEEGITSLVSPLTPAEAPVLVVHLPLLDEQGKATALLADIPKDGRSLLSCQRWEVVHQPLHHIRGFLDEPPISTGSLDALLVQRPSIKTADGRSH